MAKLNGLYLRLVLEEKTKKSVALWMIVERRGCVRLRMVMGGMMDVA